MEIHSIHKDFGYRRLLAELRRQGYLVNKKRVQRIMQKLSIQVTSFTRKSRKYSSYKGTIGKVAPTDYGDVLILKSHTRRLRLILQSLSIMM